LAVYTHVSAEALGEFLTLYDVGELVSAKGIAEGVENSNYMVDTTKGRFFLTLYEKRVEADDLPYFMALLDHLADKGLPVPPAIKDRNGVEIQELEGRPACLIKFLPGVSLSHPTPSQALSAGRALAEMHTAASDFSLNRANSMGVESWQPLFERCGDDLDSIAPNFRRDLGWALDEVLTSWPANDGLPVGPIHADLFPDNVLMTGNNVSGLIDFYFACTDIRAYDLAVMHTSWGFDANGAPLDAEIGRAILRGYQSILPLSDAERQFMLILCKGACVRFMLSRAWDWLNTPPGALVTRKDPLAYWRRYEWYDDHVNATAAINA